MLLATASTAAFAADIYQWKDANGVTHYSDSPPTKGAFRTRGRQAAAPAPDTARANTAAAGNVPAGEPCSVAQENLNRLRGTAVVGLDANGDGVPDATMTDAQRAEQITLAQKYLADRCTQAAGTAASPR